MESVIWHCFSGSYPIRVWFVFVSCIFYCQIIVIPRLNILQEKKKKSPDATILSNSAAAIFILLFMFAYYNGVYSLYPD